MLRTLFLILVVFTLSTPAEMLIIEHYLHNEFPHQEDGGGITNTTAASIQDGGSLGNEIVSAEVSYGSAKVSAQTSSGAERNGTANAGLVSWQDTLTITAPGYDFSGFIYLAFSLSGMLDANSTPGASAGASYQVQIDYDQSTFYSRLGGDSGGDPLEDFTADGKGFDFGQAFDLRVALGVYTGSGSDFDSGSSASATDVELTLTDITITATEGGDAIAASIVSGSGTSYPVNVVPEPASASLLILSAVGFFIYRRILVS